MQGNVIFTPFINVATNFQIPRGEQPEAKRELCPLPGLGPGLCNDQGKQWQPTTTC